jgi:hypothetical protein
LPSGTTQGFQPGVLATQKCALKMAREPPSLFELRRVRKTGKGRAIAKRRRMRRRPPMISIRYGRAEFWCPFRARRPELPTQG